MAAGVGVGWGVGGVAVEVAVLAGGSEVVGVEPWSAVCDWDDVVGVGGVDGAVRSFDLAAVVVSLEDLFADSLPRSGVLGFGHDRFLCVRDVRAASACRY